MADRLFVTCEHAGNVVPRSTRTSSSATSTCCRRDRGCRPGRAAARARDGRPLRGAALLRRDDPAARRPQPLGRARPTCIRRRRGTSRRRSGARSSRRTTSRTGAVSTPRSPPPSPRPRRRATGSSTASHSLPPSCTARSAAPTSACSTIRAGPARSRSRPPGSTRCAGRTRASGCAATIRISARATASARWMRRRYPPTRTSASSSR